MGLSKGSCELGGGVLFEAHVVLLFVVVVDARDGKVSEPAGAFLGEHGGRCEDVCLDGLQGDAGVLPRHHDL